MRFALETADANFKVTPASGSIGAKQKKEIVVTFNSDAAKVIIGTMICRLNRGDEEKTRVLKMSAMSKYPFITTNQEKCDFESLLVGKTASETITVKNSSLVNTKIILEKCSDDNKDNSFSCNFSSGVLAPNEE